MASPTPSAQGCITSRPGAMVHPNRRITSHLGVMLHVFSNLPPVSMWLYFPEERDEQQAAIIAETLAAVHSYYVYCNFFTFEVPIVDLQAAATALYRDDPTAQLILWNSRQMDDIVFAARTRAGLPAVDPATSSHTQSPPPSGGISAQVLRSSSTLYHYLTGGRKLAGLPEDAAATDSQRQTGTDDGPCICTRKLAGLPEDAAATDSQR